jgi:hypothetical protein
MPSEAEKAERAGSPIRIQRKRTKGWRMPENTVYVGRPSRWGNPFPVVSPGDPEEHTRAVAAFRKLIMAPPSRRRHTLLTVLHGNQGRGEGAVMRMRDSLHELRGKNLACCCALISHGVYVPCHADVLLSIANDIPMEEVIRENTRWAEGQTLR